MHWHGRGIAIGYCCVCDATRVFVRYADNEIATRCLVCRATLVTNSVVRAVSELVEDLGTKHAYEMSARGGLHKYLVRHSGSATYSEYWDDVPPGGLRNGVQCQDVQRLTFANCSFDVCTSTEVPEHVPEDAKALSELHRVLKPSGLLIFTVPLSHKANTVERARMGADDKIEHLLPAEYHRDPAKGRERILAFRNYGYDILDRMIASGFVQAEILLPLGLVWGYGRPVVVGYREKESSLWVDCRLFVFWNPLPDQSTSRGPVLNACALLQHRSL